VGTSLADRAPALARVEFDLFVGVPQRDPNGSVEDIERVFDAAVIVPGNPLGRTHPHLSDPESRAFSVTRHPLGKLTRALGALHRFLLAEPAEDSPMPGRVRMA